MSEQKAVPKIPEDLISLYSRARWGNASISYSSRRFEPKAGEISPSLTSLIERIAVQQERIAALEGMLAENKRVLEIAMDTVARLSAPVSDAEWLDLCAGDALQITDVQRHGLDRFIAARTVPPAPQDTEKDAG